MPRLVSLPYPRLASIDWLSGPNARNSGSNTAMDGSEQTFDSVGDVVSLRLNFAIAKGTLARRNRGFVTAVPSGNAFRLTYIDPDRMKPAEAGIVGSYVSQPWSNGEPWSNGMNWHPAYPTVQVAAVSDYDSGIVYLADEFWGHELGMGDHIGFFPFHFGLYTVTEVIAAGQYRIWPRLRKALAVTDFCTLNPTVVMKPMSKAVAAWTRDPSHQNGVVVDCSEVIDEYVRSYFTE